MKKEKADKEVAKKAQGSNRDLFGAKKDRYLNNRHISIVSDESDIELSEEEESSRSVSEKDKGNTGQGADCSDSETDSKDSDYSLSEDRREKMRKNRSKTQLQQNWEKTIGETSIRAEMPKKTSKVKVDIPKKVNNDAKWKNAVVYNDWCIYLQKYLKRNGVSLKGIEAVDNLDFYVEGGPKTVLDKYVTNT